MEYEFITVDVFTTERFGGNPLAVFPRAEGLGSAQMQRIANEFNLSETTFVLPPDDPAHTAKVRIFTPRSELPFAGHPNIGTGFVLARGGDVYGRTPGERMLFEELSGLVAVDVERQDGTVTATRLTSPQPFDRGGDLDAALIASTCGLDAQDIVTDGHPPCLISCGMVFAVAELASLDTLGAAAPGPDRFAEHLPFDRAPGLLLYVPTNGGEVDIRARMFAPSHGIPEDPATGSAIVALVGLIASLAKEADADLTLSIAQGVEMGRPSFMNAGAQKRGGTVTDTWIGGASVEVLRGTINLD